jgi:hypothetical protein
MNFFKGLKLLYTTLSPTHNEVYSIQQYTVEKFEKFLII